MEVRFPGVDADWREEVEKSNLNYPWGHKSREEAPVFPYSSALISIGSFCRVPACVCTISLLVVATDPSCYFFMASQRTGMSGFLDPGAHRTRER